MTQEGPSTLTRPAGPNRALKRSVSFAHHGGTSTTTTAALAGAPQVIIPQMHDQHYWAQRVERLGLGVAHAPGAPTTESLTSALKRALQPDVAPRARSVAGAYVAMVRTSPRGV